MNRRSLSPMHALWATRGRRWILRHPLGRLGLTLVALGTLISVLGLTGSEAAVIHTPPKGTYVQRPGTLTLDWTWEGTEYATYVLFSPIANPNWSDIVSRIDGEGTVVDTKELKTTELVLHFSSTNDAWYELPDGRTIYITSDGWQRLPTNGRIYWRLCHKSAAHLTCYSESDYDRNGVRWFAVGSEPPAQPTPPPSASPPSQPGQVSVRLSKPFGIPSPPRAGQRFQVAATVVRTDAKPVRSGAVACRARAGTTSVAAKGRIASESARCEMTLPRTARGKRLQGTMTVSVANAEAVTKRFVFRVR